MWGVFFGEFQCLPVDYCPAASCDSGVLARGSESTSFYSAILVPLVDILIGYTKGALLTFVHAFYVIYLKRTKKCKTDYEKQYISRLMLAKFYFWIKRTTCWIDKNNLPRHNICMMA